jgi:hypothetical protein
MVVLGRSDGPPLRFRGEHAAAHAATAAGETVEIDLWRRDAGGWAVSLVSTCADHRRLCATLAASLDDAMAFLEAEVDGARPPPRPRQGRQQAEAMAGALTDAARGVVRRESRAVLVGDALAGWTDLADGQIA